MLDLAKDGAGLKTKKRTVRVSLDELKIPPIAWPTVFLSIFSTTLFVSCVVGGVFFGWSLWITVPLQAFASFLGFTPLHDSVHGSASNGTRWLNGLIGRVCALAIMAPYPAFRYVHLEHHKHTNDPEKDPDFYSSGNGNVLLLPLFWLTQDYHYYPVYFSKVASRPFAEVGESIIVILLILAGVIYSIVHDNCYYAFFYYVLPSKIAVTTLAYSFDYAPHAPHTHKRVDDEYKTTAKIGGLFSSSGVELTLPLLWQNYHNIHHLYPSIPFYQYQRIWDNHKDELIKAGTPVVPFVNFG